MRRGNEGVCRFEVVHLAQQPRRSYNEKQKEPDSWNSAHDIFSSEIWMEINAVWQPHGAQGAITSGVV